MFTTSFQTENKPHQTFSCLLTFKKEREREREREREKREREREKREREREVVEVGVR